LRSRFDRADEPRCVGSTFSIDAAWRGDLASVKNWSKLHVVRARINAALDGEKFFSRAPHYRRSCAR
jgi:hypothetical protein